MNIKVIGTSSSNRMKLVKNIIKALKELNLNIIPEIIDDNNSLIKYKNKNTPILIINEQIVSNGNILSEREIKNYLKLLA